MTNLIFLPDDTTAWLITSARKADELSAEILGGNTTALTPFLAVCPQADGLPDFEIVRLGETLLILNARLAAQPPEGNSPVGQMLSPRQMDILNGLCRGQTTKQIARELEISPRAVTMHIARLKQTLGAVTISQTIERAVSLGLFPPARTRRRPLERNLIPRG